MENYIKSKEYIDYLKGICGVLDFDFTEESNPRLYKDTIIFNKFAKWLKLNRKSVVLEVGCGLGRLINEIYKIYSPNVYGIDTFENMINAAKERVGNKCKSLDVASLENMTDTYQNESFSHVVCWGVFDLSDQNLALINIFKLLNTGGKLLLRGKNDHYNPLDKEAIIAEVKCREKNIYNHFTHYDGLLKFIKKLGGVVTKETFFPIRGDVISENGVIERPKQFYEYAVLIEKRIRKDYNNKDILSFPEISSLYSVTYKNLKN